MTRSPLLDWNGAAERLGVTPRMVRELWAQRKLAAVHVGRHVRFAEEDLDRFIEANRTEAVGQVG
jgi:excisionase family DNA binding protein